MMRRFVLTGTFLLLLSLGLGIGLAMAQEKPSSTLEKMRRNGVIYIAHHESSIPFSYLDGSGQAIGFSMDLCGHVVNAVKERLGRPDLKIVQVPTTSGSRQIMVEAGVVDLNCGSATNTEQRQRYVAFSVTTFVSGVKALVRRGSGINSLADMAGKVVATTSGTTGDGYVKAAANRRGLLLNFRQGRDHADSLRLLIDGQADVMVLDDVLLKGLLMDLPETQASQLVMLEEDLGAEPYAIMFRRNDPEFKKLVDDTLSGLMQSGEFSRIYNKWFMSPIPPGGKSMNLPMSDSLKQLILTPNDRGI